MCVNLASPLGGKHISENQSVKVGAKPFETCGFPAAETAAPNVV